ncbi:hypothetical protein Patl1_33696 [Pistacia atlantica]|uniref:Uncharacterized protein n=1 Tax=Pistacia atlantica TaxID=434234 RepID=A0ACC0ZT03_9ROSI|nr:hypothetical protein Patl1_33696 [Pistacia atlantica]
MDLPKSILLLIFRYYLFIFQNLHRFSISITFDSFQETISSVFQAPIVVASIDTMLSLYFHMCNLSPCTIDLDDKTTMHFWTPKHRRLNKPDLVILHGYGGNSRWQFVYQVGSLSNRFNLYVPDLLFFGKSYTTRLERSDYFQAECAVEGLKKLGVERFSVYGISYGGYVAYRMAEIYPQVVEKVVIVSSGICCTENQKDRHLKRIGRSLLGILVPQSPQDLRLLVNLSVSNQYLINWAPDFMLRQFIKIMYDSHRKQKQELAEYLLYKGANPNMPILSQETLIIWGDQDNFFPLDFGYQLHSHLGPKSRLEIIKNTGHAANVQSPSQLNSLITSFVLAQS